MSTEKTTNNDIFSLAVQTAKNVVKQKDIAPRVNSSCQSLYVIISTNKDVQE